MKDITVSAIFTAVISIPESQSGDTVTYVIYRASNGAVFASGSMTYLAGINWKVSFTPTAIDNYVLEVNDTTIDVKHTEVFCAVGTVTPTPTPDSDYTYDITTNLGKVRALISDTNAASVILGDAKINAFLSMKSNDLYATAALALNAIATSKSLLAKKKSSGDYSEDLTAIAKECRATAAIYQEMSENIPAEAQAEGFFNDFSYRDVTLRKMLRDETE
jgi:hypothetical protein